MILIDLLTGNTSKQVASQAEKKFGVNKNQIIALLVVATPLIISYLRKKSQNAKEAEALSTALEKDHDGSILNHPEELEHRQKEGDSILNHIFGAEKSQVQNSLSENTGISMDKIGPILAMLAPLIMGFIGKQKQSQNVNSGGIGDLLGSILGQGERAQNSGVLGGILEGVLGGNKQGAGSPLNELLSKVIGGGEKSDASPKDGLGGLLSSILGK